MDVSTPNQSLALPDDAHTRDGVATSEGTQLQRRDQPKEVDSDARQEEGRGQAARPDREARNPSEARRGRRRQERLARLMRPWWEEDPAQLASELDALAAAGFTLVHQGFTTGCNLRLELQRKRRRYELVFEDDYPRGGVVMARRFRAGAELRADEQVGTASGPLAATLALNRLRDRSLESARTAIGGRVLLPYPWHRLGESGHGTMTFGVARAGVALLPMTITGVSEAAANRLAEASSHLTPAFPTTTRGLWVSGSDAHGRSVSLVEHVEKQLAAAHGLDPRALRIRLRFEIGALCNADPYYNVWHFVRRSASGEPLVMETVRADQDEYPERAPYARALEGRHVALVGCGAVGWPVAVMLARSGVRRFTLYDDDKIAMHNLSRLGAFVSDAGRFKVQALATQLETIAPDIRIDRVVAEVGRHVGAGALLEGEPDLLINLTGEERSTDETNLAALRLEVPAVFAWVSYGVAAGRIFRVRPFASACYECVRESSPETIRTYGRVEPGTHRPWVGSVIDVEAFASTVAQVAVRTLRGDGVSHANPDHLLLDFGGLSPRPRRVDVPRDARCRVCR